MSQIVGIVDIETTNFLNKGGKLVEVGVAGLDLGTGQVRPLFHSLVREPGLTGHDRSAWVFQNSDLTPDQVRDAPALESIRLRLQAVLYSTAANTAFNKAFDFPFLRSRGFDVGVEWPCPMHVATPIVKAPHKVPGRPGYKWPSVEEAWAHFFPDQPYVEAHRGLDDAMHEARIVYELFKQGLMT